MSDVSVVKRLDGPAAREALAEYAHDAWAGWMKYMFEKGVLLNENGMTPEPGEPARLMLPTWAVDRWTRQAYTAYPDLPDSEKESDRLEADRILEILDRVPLESA